jgi:uncharacterized membrane protein YphA (DoxX/SURF4 family)
VGLLLLRSALGAVGITEGMHCVTGMPSLASQAVGGVLIVSGAFVALGLYTSLASVAGAVSAALLAFLVPLPLLCAPNGALGAGVVVVLGVAIALLGPGALSLDFRLFGRREIIIPRDSSFPTARR